MGLPAVTVIVVPRERFSSVPRSLECVYRDTNVPFNLVYVDGGSPEKTKRYLEAEARSRGFQLIRTSRGSRGLCLAVGEAGGAIYLEPEAVVNWVTPPPLAWSDLPYFMLRWSDAWNRESVRRFREKWRLVAKDPNDHYEFVTAYRRRALEPVRRAIRSVLGWRRATWVERHSLFPFEEALNRLFIPKRFAQRG